MKDRILQAIKNIPTLRAQSFNKKYPELYCELIEWAQINDIVYTYFPELVWQALYGLRPKCKCCTNTTKFIGFNRGWMQYCKNIKCRTSDPEWVQWKLVRDQQALEQKYGAGIKNMSQIPGWKEKTEQTKLSRTGYKWHTQLLNARKNASENIIKNSQKIKDGLIKKYGVDNPSLIQSIVDKKIETFNSNRYAKYNTIAAKYRAYFIEEVNKSYIYFQCSKGHFFHTNYQLLQIRNTRNEEICTHCNLIHKFTSVGETKLYQFISEKYSGTIKQRVKTLIDGEIDIYLPELGIAFEFNGTYWHSELYKDKHYHLDKTDSCLLKGVKLIHIWQDDWLYKREIVQSRILNLLGKSKKIYARNCTIKEVSSMEANFFLTKNHIQGQCLSKVRLGLYHHTVLVAVMTFGKRKLNGGHWELLRWCSELNTTVIGGASKLFQHFIKIWSVDIITSYADRDWSVGDLYTKLGFVQIASTVPDYTWVVDGLRSHRLNWSKKKLVSLGLLEAGETEEHCMWRLGRYRIYGTGSLKFIYNI